MQINTIPNKKQTTALNQKTTPQLPALPSEMLREIFSYLKTEDVEALSLVNKTLKAESTSFLLKKEADEIQAFFKNLIYQLENPEPTEPVSWTTYRGMPNELTGQERQTFKERLEEISFRLFDETKDLKRGLALQVSRKEFLLKTQKKLLDTIKDLDTVTLQIGEQTLLTPPCLGPIFSLVLIDLYVKKARSGYPELPPSHNDLLVLELLLEASKRLCDLGNFQRPLEFMNFIQGRSSTSFFLQHLTDLFLEKEQPEKALDLTLNMGTFDFTRLEITRRVAEHLSNRGELERAKALTVVTLMNQAPLKASWDLLAEGLKDCFPRILLLSLGLVYLALQTARS